MLNQLYSIHNIFKGGMSVFLLTLFLILLITQSVEARQQTDLINPELLENTWDASWISHPTESPFDYGVFHFRNTIDLESVPDSFVIHVSGDARYRLYINGHYVAKGPAVGDKHNWRFETIDISDWLTEGQNILAATVWNFAEYRALAHHSHRTAFLMQGNSELESAVNTGNEWKVMKNHGYSPIPVSSQDVGGYFAASHGEHLRAETYPWGWKNTGYDDSDWMTASSYLRADPRGQNNYGNLYGWNLIPRNIPMMEEHVERIPDIRRMSGIRTTEGFLQGTETLVIPPETTAVLLLDQTYLVNAHPVLVTSGGREAEIKLTYAESLRHEDNTKGNRDEIEGKEILGMHDIFISDGGDHRTFQTLWQRTYRYIQLEVKTSDEPLEIHDLYGIYTAYPFEENASFTSNDSGLQEIWEAGWRTARLNAFESYWDCPYYEQLQYVGDTRIQALISLYVSGDDRLMRNALLHFDHSRSPDGITMSRYPSSHPQYIPPYSLLWIAMVHDYWMHRDDDAFVRQFLPGIRSVIQWYENHIDEDSGILGPMPWWNYVDAANGFQRGTPPGSDDGNSIVISLQMIYVLQYAAEIADALGQDLDKQYYETLLAGLQENVVRLGWNEERQLFADTPDQNRYSQHANILAILTNLVPESNQARLVQKIMEDDSLVQATYYFKFYLFRAMIQAGLGNEYLDRLSPWYDALELGMTTFPEHPEPSRSDAHAWSSSPNYDFLATVAGIRPDSPGFKTVRIEPHPGQLEWLNASIPHPLGTITVNLEKSDTGIEGEITLPEGLTGRFIWNGEEINVQGGTQTISSNE